MRRSGSPLTWQDQQNHHLSSQNDPETYSTFSQDDILPGNKKTVWNQVSRSFTGKCYNFRFP